MKVTQTTAIAVYIATAGVYALGPLQRRQDVTTLLGPSGSFSIDATATDEGELATTPSPTASFSDTVISVSLPPTDSGFSDTLIADPSEEPTNPGSVTIPSPSVPIPSDLQTPSPRPSAPPVPPNPDDEPGAGEDGQDVDQEGSAVGGGVSLLGLGLGAAIQLLL
ncbi:hypothetical protein BDV98DRAFT_574178 [Pterulicium gracile]|uniref:Uncharacterized protein n=1 Tax=Pterulicium gracile TaxID=1884261 RepID=A0A5C3PZT2_9AGAR|nr:hypothetical protein BDV98DRAFT_578224 [Pterula gracilis]TFK97526.1 hypothetical protein BDV98DRAFT_574178 [Pterula gracilis]